MKIINTLAILTSAVCLFTLLFGLYQNEYFAGSLAFWFFTLGGLFTAIIGVITGGYCDK